MAIPEKLDLVIDTKNKIKQKIDSTGQDTTNASFRDYEALIRNIPNTGAMTYEDVDELTSLVVSINGEEA